MATRRTNPLPQLIPLRVRRAKERVEALVWRDHLDLAVAGGPVNAEPVDLAAAQRQALASVTPGECFGPPGGGWQQRWFQVSIPVGEGARFLEWRCDGEATAYLDGRPWAGLDCAHRTCPVPDGAATLWIDHGTYATGVAATRTPPIGPYGCRFDGARLARRDPLAWKIAWDLDALSQVVESLLRDGGHAVAADRYGHQAALDRASPHLRLLLHLLDQACDAFDHDGLEAFGAALDGVFARLRAEPWQPRVAVCPQSHLDLVWLWPEREAERKAVHTVATMMRLFDAYPELVFSASQPAMVRAIERRAPALAAEVRARIAEGRWEAVGAFDVEPDTQLPAGEALARSLVIGQRALAKLRGTPNRVCWLPDVFGYAACLPQLLRLAGVDRFFTTKLRWSAISRFPHQSFVWRGADGSEVLAQISTVGYTGVCDADTLITAAREYSQHGAHDELLLAQGLGDGGGGPTEAMLERARRFADLSGVPRVHLQGADPFFDRLDAARDGLPVFQGELYLEYHRGTFTTQGELKRLYRRAETALQAREAVRVARGAGPLEDRAWERVAFAQFHDALPGSSIGLVYEQLCPELQALGDQQLAAAARELGGDAQAPVLFNPLPFARRALSPDGARIVELPGCGCAPADGPALPANVEPVRAASPRLLDNGVVRVAFDEAGGPVAFDDRGAALDLVAPAGLVLYVDQPAKFDAWDIDHQALRRGVPVRFTDGLSVEEQTPARAVLRGQAPLGARSSVEIRYALEAGSPWLRVELTVDWREDHRLLKFHLPTGYRGRWARFGAPFGSVQRPQLPGTQADEAMWEVPGSRWAAVTDDGGEGAAIVSEAKYGFSCRDGDLALSLLRAPSDPDPGADRGTHTIRFALGRHRAATDGPSCEGLSTAAAAEALFAPVLAATGDVAPPPFRATDLGTLLPSWVLPAEGGGFVLRLHETNGQRGVAAIELRDPSGAVELVDLLERPLDDQTALERLRDRKLRLAYRPHQILSLRVRPGARP